MFSVHIPALYTRGKGLMKVFISPRNNANNSRPKIWEKTRD